MPKHTLPPSILLALGIGGCKSIVGPCLDIAVETDTDTDSDTDTDTDADTDTDTDADTDIGPCLDIAPSGDTGVGPCLSPPLPTADTASTETGAASTGDTGTPAPTANRADLVRQLVERGVLSDDTVRRLLGED